MRLTSVLVLLCVCLTGCFGTTPVIEYRTRSVPVVIPCVEERAVIPSWATAKLKSNSDLSETADAYIIELKQREQYELELNAIIAGCEIDG